MKTKKISIGKIVLFFVGLAAAVLYLAPVLILVNSSFKSLKEIYLNILALPETLTFTNYTAALDALDFGQTFLNSVVITVVSTALILLVSSMAAWALARYKTKTSKILFMIFAAAQLIPFQCVMLPLVDFMDKLHLMNRQGLIFMYVGFGCSMSIVMFHGFISNVPKELEEAATIDGCNLFQTFFRIVFPLLKTILVTVAILEVMWIWNDFLLPQLVINKPGWQTLPLKTYLFFGQFTKKWDLATAGLVICMLPIVIFYLLCQKHIVKGVTEGAVK